MHMGVSFSPEQKHPIFAPASSLQNNLVAQIGSRNNIEPRISGELHHPTSLPSLP